MTFIDKGVALAEIQKLKSLRSAKAISSVFIEKIKNISVCNPQITKPDTSTFNIVQKDVS